MNKEICTITMFLFKVKITSVSFKRKAEVSYTDEWNFFKNNKNYLQNNDASRHTTVISNIPPRKCRRNLVKSTRESL